MDKSKIENAINHITSLQENSRLHGEYAAVYESYFHTCCGFSFYDRVCNSILVYEYGDRPF